jgi:tetratricopeptide (TPR) repeat protein
MKKLTKKITVSVIIVMALLFLLFVANLVWGRTVRMARANRDLLTEGRLAAAQKTYEDLAVDLPESPYVLHNLGLAAYRQGRYQPAAAYFQKALEKLKKHSGRSKRRNELTARCHYHLGGSQFKIAESGAAASGQNVAQAPPVDLYNSALDNFRRALEITPSDLNAKYNYELTRLRADKARNQNQNQPDQDQDQNKKDQKNKPNERQDQQNQAQSNQSGRDQKQPPKQKGQKEQSGKNAADRQQKQGMTKEEARALLDMAENGAQYMAPILRDNSAVQKDW